MTEEQFAQRKADAEALIRRFEEELHEAKMSLEQLVVDYMGASRRLGYAAKMLARENERLCPLWSDGEKRAMGISEICVGNTLLDMEGWLAERGLSIRPPLENCEQCWFLFLANYKPLEG